MKAIFLAGLVAFTTPAFAADTSAAQQDALQKIAPKGNVIWDSLAVPYNAQTRGDPYRDPYDVLSGAHIKGPGPLLEQHLPKSPDRPLGVG